MRFAILPLHLSQVLRLPRKMDARSYEVLHLSRKIIFPKLKIWCSKMQPLSGNQRPDLLTSLMNMSLVLRRPRDMHLCRSSANVPRLPSFLEALQNPHVCSLLARCRIPCACHAKPHLNLQKWSEPGVFCIFWLGNVLRATTAYTFSTSQLPKVVRTWCALHILTWKRASRHNGVHFFDVSTSKSAPRPSCFNTFDFEMCFAPLRRALFRHHNFQKWSDVGVFCTFWLGNVLRATTACNFSSLIHGSAPAALASLLFDPPEPQIIEKHSVVRLCYLFAHLHLLSSDSFSSLIFFLLFFSSLTLPTSAFHLSIMSEVWLLNFLRPSFIGKSTIEDCYIFNSYVTLPEGVMNHDIFACHGFKICFEILIDPKKLVPLLFKQPPIVYEKMARPMPWNWKSLPRHSHFALFDHLAWCRAIQSSRNHVFTSTQETLAISMFVFQYAGFFDEMM